MGAIIKGGEKRNELMLRTNSNGETVLYLNLEDILNRKLEREKDIFTNNSLTIFLVSRKKK